MGMLLPCSCILIWFQDSLRDLLKAYNARSCIPLGFYLMHATLIVCLGRVFMQHHTTASLIICNAFQNAAFATTSASVPSRKSWLPAGFGGSGKHGATIDIPLEDPKKKERELLSWEQDLKRREQDIKRREDAMNRAGVTVEVRNWPQFYPIIHHDIANEIPIHAQKLQYTAFASWLGLIACLVWNFFAVLVESIRSEDIVSFLLAVIYAMSGCPLSYILWYRPLYRAMRTDSVVTFGQFFAFYSIHVGFCVIAAIAPPIIFKEKTLTGILVAIEVLAGDMLVGVLYFIGFVFFALESLISIWVLERVYMYFRGHR
ncbi:secretory carrier-associated membrane protein 4-like isoform X1 [Panicum virgatum]|uniref:secretory carrier-associated membrane protein 4-like isoform X1 n=1 Tax=Panicum virgatum TaxID=38727 RepID=UPI0019D6991B|nr:secretory carrier-associated membrane protein 4-like isoform X1 [Panicum virgatum]